MVEKPIATTVAEAEEMVALAEAHNRVLAVGHVEFHNPAVQAALGLADGVRYLEAQRLSPFTARSVDVDVILDLMIHDLQITLAVAGTKPRPTSAPSASPSSPTRSTCATPGSSSPRAWSPTSPPAGYRRSASASSACSPSDGYFSVDYAEQSVSSARLVRSDRAQRSSPRRSRSSAQEPLGAELEAFVAACRGQNTPLVDGRTGAAALEAAIKVRESVEERQ